MSLACFCLTSASLARADATPSVSQAPDSPSSTQSPSRTSSPKPQTTSAHPKGPHRTHTRKPPPPSVDSLKAVGNIGSINDFLRLARVYKQGRGQAIPHLLFLIDRADKGRIYFINANLYLFHLEFANATYLSLERSTRFYQNSYGQDDRRFILGTIALRRPGDRYTFQFFEGDRLAAALLKETYQAISKHFFAPITFEPTSTGQLERLGLVQAPSPTLPLQAEVLPVPTSIPLELQEATRSRSLVLGQAIGRLRRLEQLTEETPVDRTDILLVRQVPLMLPPVAGLLLETPASPFSSACMLAQRWRIPMAWQRDAGQASSGLEGQWVVYAVREGSLELRAATAEEIAGARKARAAQVAAIPLEADLTPTPPTDLKKQRSKDAVRFGQKSAYLGEVLHGRFPGVTVPAGFTLPFSAYVAFVHENQLQQPIQAMLADPRFQEDRAYRLGQLEALRKRFQAGTLNPLISKEILNKVHVLKQARGFYVRTSTNAENLPGFNGTGLYTTVPNVVGDDALLEAVKTVWGSLWNARAYEAREAFGLDHLKVYPAVLIQEAIPAESAGVAITADPFDPRNRNVIYFSARHGVGTQEANAEHQPEQLIHAYRRRSTRLLTRSDEDTMLAFDAQGGVKELTIVPGRPLLTHTRILSLSLTARRMRAYFQGRDQELDWAYAHNRLYILQVQTFVRANPLTGGYRTLLEQETQLRSRRERRKGRP